MKDSRYGDIDTLLEEVVTLPSMPSSLARITELLEDPNCEVHEIAEAISGDPAIALKTLRVVNSAFYGLGQEVTTVDHAVVLLGMRVIKNLVLTATVMEIIGPSARQFLKHSVACGMAMRSLAHFPSLRAHVESSDEAFTFGLLHDIGKIILEEYLPEEYGEVEQLVKTSQMPWFEAEREILGVDHAELGARLAGQWKLSNGIVDAIAGHHDLRRCNGDTTVAAHLCLADYLCTVSGMPSHEPATGGLPEATWQATGLERSQLPAVFERFMSTMPAVSDLLRLAM